MLHVVPPSMVAAFLYLGAGIGVGTMMLIRYERKRPSSEERLHRRDIPYTVAMVVLDIAAPITQQIDDRLQAFESDNQMLNALAVLMPSNEVTLLLSLLFSIEDRAKLYYISGGKTSSGGTAAATASQPSA